MKQETLEYEYQLKASVKAQAMERERQIKEQQSEQGQEFIKDVLKKAEKEKRESNRQNLMIGFSMLSNSISQGLQNPQTLKKIVYLSFGCFSAFHFSRVFFSLLSTRILSTFGKPKLVFASPKRKSSRSFGVYRKTSEKSRLWYTPKFGCKWTPPLVYTSLP